MTEACKRNARRLGARDNWPPISWVDWPPNVGQLAAGLMTSERPVSILKTINTEAYIASGIIGCTTTANIVVIYN